MAGITRIFGRGTEDPLLRPLCRVKAFEVPNFRMSVRRRWSFLALSLVAECIRRRGPYVSLSSDHCEHAARGELRWLRDQVKSLHPTRTSRMYAHTLRPVTRMRFATHRLFARALNVMDSRAIVVHDMHCACGTSFDWYVSRARDALRRSEVFIVRTCVWTSSGKTRPWNPNRAAEAL